jgi:DNA-binding response OmpR family regulator
LPANDQRKLLVVEDEASIRQILEIKGRSSGFDVRSSANGKDALDTAREWLPDLVITDHRMPEMSGVELIHRLRGIPGLVDMPIILLTGSVVAEYQFSVQLENIRKVTVLRKPFSPRELFARVNDIMTASANG